MFVVLKKNSTRVHTRCKEQDVHNYDLRLFTLYTESSYNQMLKKTPLFTLQVYENGGLVYRSFKSVLELKGYRLTASLHIKLIEDHYE